MNEKTFTYDSVQKSTLDAHRSAEIMKKDDSSFSNVFQKTQLKVISKVEYSARMGDNFVVIEDLYEPNDQFISAADVKLAVVEWLMDLGFSVESDGQGEFDPFTISW